MRSVAPVVPFEYVEVDVVDFNERGEPFEYVDVDVADLTPRARPFGPRGRGSAWVRPPGSEPEIQASI